MALDLGFLKKASFWSHLGAIVAGVAGGIAAGGKPLVVVISVLKGLLGAN